MMTLKTSLYIPIWWKIVLYWCSILLISNTSGKFKHEEHIVWNISRLRSNWKSSEPFCNTPLWPFPL